MQQEEIEILREEGKQKYFEPDGLPETKSEGLRMIRRASSFGDAEAAYILGAEMLKGRLDPVRGDRGENARRMLVTASRRGSVQARALLSSLCEERRSAMARPGPSEPHPLTGFDGKPVRIDRKGLFVPVDARLTFDGQTNILTLRANVNFVFSETDGIDRDRFRQAVMQGFRDWEGDYEVFGGQPLKVRLELTDEERLKDSVHVIPIAREIRTEMQSLTKKLMRGKRGRQTASLIAGRRSFVGWSFGRWSVRSTKIIWMQCRNDRFDDGDALRNTAKHEFGHVLGLGDLYASEADGLEGVDPEKYEELGCFHMFGRWYYAVMCDENAPVSGNDIEMVVLAFSKNRAQRFQPDRYSRRLSEALGRGD